MFFWRTKSQWGSILDRKLSYSKFTPDPCILSCARKPVSILELWWGTCFCDKRPSVLQKSSRPTICNGEGEPLQTRYAGVQYFRVGPQLEPRHAVLHKGQWFSSNDNIRYIFRDWWTFIAFLQMCFSIWCYLEQVAAAKQPVWSCRKCIQRPQSG